MFTHHRNVHLPFLCWCVRGLASAFVESPGISFFTTCHNSCIIIIIYLGSAVCGQFNPKVQMSFSSYSRTCYVRSRTALYCTPSQCTTEITQRHIRDVLSRAGTWVSLFQHTVLRRIDGLIYTVSVSWQDDIPYAAEGTGKCQFSVCQAVPPCLGQIAW